MCFRRPAFLSSLVVVGLIGLALATPSSAVFMDLGTSGWEFEVESANASIPAANIDVPAPASANNTNFLLKGAVGLGNPKIVVHFRTKGAFVEIERFFMMDMEITTGVSVSEFKIRVDDLIDLDRTRAASGTEQVHPIWAHIHPRHNASNTKGGAKGPDYKGFNTLDPDTTLGVEFLTLTGNTVAAGNSWTPLRLRLHDTSTGAYKGDGEKGKMDFRLTVEIPTPGTLVLFVVGLWTLGALVWGRAMQARPAKS